jgi:branched-chain amino acid transport system substrate-binding protein
MSRVYASLPLTGSVSHAGRDVLRGAQLALERRPELELVALDSFAAPAAEHARRATLDDRALAYLGDFHSRDVSVTAPILGEAGLLQIAPVATYVGLGGPTLVRLSPHDGDCARAVASWLVARDVRRLVVVHDHDDEYGRPVGAMCVEAGRERGLEVRDRPVWDCDERAADDLGDAQAVLYVGVAGSGAAGLWADLHAADPALWLLGSDGVAHDRLARELAPEAAARTRFFVAQRAPMAFYGFEAMALILDAVAAAPDGRPSVAAAARATRDRDSVLGRYSLDADGHTTNGAYGVLAIEDRKLVWDV